MKLKQIPTGIFIEEKEVIAVELSNKKGSYVKIFNYGTIINKFVVKNSKGEEQDIVLGFDQFEDYISEDYLANYPYFGAIIGRYANRIKGGQLTVDGIGYQLPQNAGSCCLHGGNKGFDRKVWDILETFDSPNAKVTFQYYSFDGEEGFPGDLAIQLSFEFTDNDELILAYQADTDEATPINLTHHSYFNLAANGEKITAHIHEMNASHYLAQDEEWTVTGELIPVAGTIHDFTKARTIGSNWNEIEGYDQTYVLDKEYGTLTLASKTTETGSGLSLLVYTTEPVAHLYTSKYLSVKGGKGGRDYGPFDAFCVETQHHPNGINIPHFPSTILRPDEVYTQTTIYKVIAN
ncbi:aldose epimerase family protein [Pedobacter insulae]|uniref:Aldose 1-epimerase n=1 Tax=Pedobacter insulae TaxID=414048 RepID=A0A1I3AKI3_9SPHI|nr:aldose epimerase family protein [Pedobacter insulae]SFH50555.1 aldose 1-epimerase [Pedobacter insulae]